MEPPSSNSAWVAPKTMADAEKQLAVVEDHATVITLRQGKLLNAIADQKLFVEKGYAEFEDWLEMEGPWSRQYSEKVMVFASVFDDEQLARKAGITRGYELIRLCEVIRDRRLDPKAIVAQDMVIAGRPFSKHTRKSLAAEITRLLELEEQAALAAMVEELAEDSSTPSFERPALTPLPSDVARQANRKIRDFVRFARDEGIDHIQTYLVKYQGEAWASMRVRADDLSRLFD